MNADQKQRATGLLAAWQATAYALHGDRMADLLQELIDAPEVLAATNPAQISSSTEPVMCPGCEGLPANSNNPCAVCWKKARALLAAPTPAEPPAPSVPELVEYDASILAGCERSDSAWWHDYIRAELGRAYEFYCGQLAAPEPEPCGWLRVVDEAMVTHHLGVADIADDYETAKKKLKALLDLNQDIREYFSTKAVTDMTLPTPAKLLYDNDTGEHEEYYSAAQVRELLAAPIADYEEVLANHRELVRELDIQLNGDNAAEQAKLCDIVAQLKRDDLILWPRSKCKIRGDVARDAERLDWLLRKLPGVVLRYCVGVLSDTSDGKEFREAIDAAIERQGGKVE